jgi:hypothetical protein
MDSELDDWVALCFRSDGPNPLCSVLLKLGRE